MNKQKGVQMIISFLVLVVLLTGAIYYLSVSKDAGLEILNSDQNSESKDGSAKNNDALVSEYVDKHPETNTVGEFLENNKTISGESLKNSALNKNLNNGGEQEIIGTVNLINDPSCPNCYTVESGGGTVTVRDASNNGGVDDGDVVVVAVDSVGGSGGSAGGNTGGNTGETIDGTVTEVISSNGGDAGDSSGGGTGSNDGADANDYEPNTNTGGSFRNLLDIDNSNIDIRIIGDY